MQLTQHPTAKAFYERTRGAPEPHGPGTIDADWLRRLCLEAGADDVGIVEIHRQEIAGERNHILAVFPQAKTLLSFVCRTNREGIRSPARSVSNMEFHSTGDQVNEAARKIVATLERHGIRAINPAMGFPMEMDRFPGRTWVISHKPVAVAAGLGRMGIHRNVIHPKFGSFILLGTVLLEAEVTANDRPIAYNPCLECKLCVSACPVGAIGADGDFNFSACYTHNYREFMGGFTDWVEKIADSKNAREYRSKVSDPESVSLWQSLSYGANYKSAYCIAVCPAGDDVIGPFLSDRTRFLREVVKPLQDKQETVYVVPGSDAEAHAVRRFPHKSARHVGNGLRPRSIKQFLAGLPLVFQRDRSVGLDATYHFTFTGDEATKATVIIRNKSVAVQDGHVATADLQIVGDSRTWLGFVAKERSLLWALLRRKLRIKGSPRLLRDFARCFPS